jgi:hypothetical protein
LLLSESKRFLFVHVQKTAGTSVTELLAPHALAPSASRFNKLVSDLRLRRDWRRCYLRRHAPLTRAERLLPTGLFRSLFKFGFVRNPWDRLVSWYSYILEDQQHHRHQRVHKLPDFAAFVHSKAGKRRASQWWMLQDRAGRLGVDFVGRYESLERDVGEICSRLGIDFRPLPRAKSSRHAPFQAFYTPALADFVATHWAREIEAFGYRFDG